jgi:hypothetical protein
MGQARQHQEIKQALIDCRAPSPFLHRSSIRRTTHVLDSTRPGKNAQSPCSYGAWPRG